MPTVTPIKPCCEYKLVLDDIEAEFRAAKDNLDFVMKERILCGECLDLLSKILTIRAGMMTSTTMYGSEDPDVDDSGDDEEDPEDDEETPKAS